MKMPTSLRRRMRPECVGMCRPQRRELALRVRLWKCFDANLSASQNAT